MCGGGYSFVPYGLAPPAAWRGNHNIYNIYTQVNQGMWGPRPKKCVCAYCGRPAKPTQENPCQGCGACEVVFKKPGSEYE